MILKGTTSRQTADLKSSEAMILAVMNAIFAIRQVQRIVEWKGFFFFLFGLGGGGRGAGGRHFNCMYSLTCCYWAEEQGEGGLRATYQNWRASNYLLF